MFKMDFSESGEFLVGIEYNANARFVEDEHTLCAWKLASNGLDFVNSLG